MLIDDFKHAFEILEHFSIPEPEQFAAALLQRVLSNSIRDFIPLPRVRVAINFDDKIAFSTEEVHHVGTDHMLAPELQARETSATQLTPNYCFCRSLFLA